MTRLEKAAVILFALMWVNCMVFGSVALYLGGTAVAREPSPHRDDVEKAGDVLEEGYYLEDRGVRTQVSHSVWRYSRIHEITVCITHSVGLLAFGGVTLRAHLKKPVT